ncbi:MAG: hypothetical protein IT577_21450 [Verrucomicrobiae bacterium]|nr:hypothetical protein [Verrucomicrobiae bacterium]
MPDSPAAIEIETFIERQFECSVDYAELPPGILGFTRFAPTGKVLQMGAARGLFDGDQVGERRARTTLAHEAGHGLLHAKLFIDPPRSDLFPEGTFDERRRQIMCREQDILGRRAYDGRWWEVQANQAIGGLLLPKALVQRALEPFMSPGRLGQGLIPNERREEAIRGLVSTFDVNPAVARIRLGSLFPPQGSQMEL